MEKWMIVFVLPLEVWMDIFYFPWINRAKFGQILDQIGNFKFAEHSQFYLHEWGKRILGRLYLDQKGLYKFVRRGGDHDPYDFDRINLDVPQTPLSQNIKSFEFIQIRYFDARTIDFLGKIRPLLNDLLEVDVSDILISSNSLENFRTILINLAPFLDGIHKLQCNEATFAMAKQYFSREKMTKLNMLKYWFHYENDAIDDEAKLQEHVNSIMDWLTQPREGPRLCEAHFCDDNGVEFLRQISAAIRQTSCAFALNMVINNFDVETVQVAEFHLENGIGDELHGKWIQGGGAKECFQIVRHPANRNTGMQEWIKHIENASIGCIYFNYPTVGSFDAAQLDVPRVGEEQAEQQQPCSSNDV